MLQLIFSKIALEKIETLLKQFVYKICKKSGSTDEAANEAGCKLYTFGSFSLGAHFAGNWALTMI